MRGAGKGAGSDGLSPLGDAETQLDLNQTSRASGEDNLYNELLSEPRERGEALELQPGASLGRYVVLRTLGAGGVGIVYRAYDPELDRRVAVKLINRETRRRANRTEARGRLVREARAMAQLNHPNIITIHDVGTFNERVFLAMEYIEGETLGEWFKRQPRTVREIVRVFTEAARGLLERAQALDEQTLVHAPELTHVRLRLAATARARRDWAAALAALEHAATELEPGDVDWDRMTMATILGRWDVVRRASARLDLALPGEGTEPIVMDIGVVRCEFVEASGRRERHWARRDSPCSARIIEIALPEDPQHFRDRVVFEPSDLDAHLRGEGPHRACFEVIEVLESGGYQSFLLRGFDPGEAAVDVLRREVRAIGAGFERISAEGRSARDPRVETEASEDEDVGDVPEVPTLAVLVALAPDDPALQLRDTVARVTGAWELPLLGPTLDEAAGDLEAAERARAMLERWKP